MFEGLKICLTKRQRQELIELRRLRNSNQGERAAYILLLDEGQTVTEISKHFKRHPHTIRSWIKRYLDRDIQGLKSIDPPGRPAVKSALVQKALPQLLSGTPRDYGYQQSGWQVNLLTDYFRKQNQEVSEDTIVRSLKAGGWVYKRFAKRVPVNSPSKEEKQRHIQGMLGTIGKELVGGKVEILFEDESHFNNEPYVERGWFKRGEKKPLRRASKKQRKPYLVR